MLTRCARTGLISSARCIHQQTHAASSEQLIPRKEEMLALDWQLEKLVPNFFKSNMGAFFQRTTKDVEFEDKIFGYKMKSPENINFHVLKVRAYCRYKSPYNKVEYLGSTYYEGEHFLTVLWRFTSLKSSFLRYFPKIVTGHAPEYNVVEGALEMHVDADARIYKLINRLLTDQDLESAKQFSLLKSSNVEEAQQREKEIAIGVAKRLAEEKQKM